MIGLPGPVRFVFYWSTQTILSNGASEKVGLRRIILSWVPWFVRVCASYLSPFIRILYYTNNNVNIFTDNVHKITRHRNRDIYRGHPHPTPHPHLSQFFELFNLFAARCSRCRQLQPSWWWAIARLPSGAVRSSTPWQFPGNLYTRVEWHNTAEVVNAWPSPNRNRLDCVQWLKLQNKRIF